MENTKRLTLKLLLGILLGQSCSSAEDKLEWQPYGRFSSNEISESSGFVKSRQFENVFWTHNDSGDKPRIFATTKEGKVIAQIQVKGAEHVDWEDIAVDNSGNLYIADTGNNGNDRRDLVVYVLAEPDPFHAASAQILKRIPFQYPDQEAYPNPRDRNFDSEALFWANGSLYCLTKHRSNRKTKLYRFDALEDEAVQTLVKIGELDVDGAVTAADVSPDGSKLLVLCYEYLYIFEKPLNNDNYLAGPSKRVLFEGRQSEGICLAENEFLITNEQAEIFKLPLSIFDSNRPFTPETPAMRVPKIDKYTLDGFDNEWSALGEDKLDLSLSAIQQSQKQECRRPTLGIARVTGGLLLIIQEWEIPKASKKNRELLYLMIGADNQRTTSLQEGAFVWVLKKSKSKYIFHPYFPKKQPESLRPRFNISGPEDRRSIEIYLPIEESSTSRPQSETQILFNAIIKAKGACEWYWASDASMFSQDNPYIWGELRLSN